MRILVVDDDDETLDVVNGALVRAGHQVLGAQSVSEALHVLETTPIDLAVLDVMLGHESGLVLCAQLRRDGLEIPILFLSARGTVSARVDGLDAGGDDYLPKPFALRELVARVRALGRRGPAIRLRRLALGRLRLDFEARRATAGETEIPVTSREWDILRALADSKGRVVTFDALLERVWGEASESTRASLEVILSRLRKKLDAAAGRSLVRTVRGVGYALEMAHDGALR